MNVKNLVLGIGIVVVFALVLWQGVEAFMPSPQWEDYCNENTIPAIPVKPEAEEREDCVANGGVWRNGYCDYYSECQRQYNEASGRHSQKVFFVSLIVAVIAVIIGFTFLKIEPVGSALIGSGIWAIFYGSVVNWRNFSTTIRFVLLLLVLVLLIWLTVKLNKKKR